MALSAPSYNPAGGDTTQHGISVHSTLATPNHTAHGTPQTPREQPRTAKNPHWSPRATNHSTASQKPRNILQRRIQICFNLVALSYRRSHATRLRTCGWRTLTPSKIQSTTNTGHPGKMVERRPIKTQCKHKKRAMLTTLGDTEILRRRSSKVGAFLIISSTDCDFLETR